MTTSFSRGSSTVMSRRLCSRAPLMTMASRPTSSTLAGGRPSNKCSGWYPLRRDRVHVALGPERPLPRAPAACPWPSSPASAHADAETRRCRNGTPTNPPAPPRPRGGEALSRDHRPAGRDRLRPDRGRRPRGGQPCDAHPSRRVGVAPGRRPPARRGQAPGRARRVPGRCGRAHRGRLRRRCRRLHARAARQRCPPRLRGRRRVRPAARLAPGRPESGDAGADEHRPARRPAWLRSPST